MRQSLFNFISTNSLTLEAAVPAAGCFWVLHSGASSIGGWKGRRVRGCHGPGPPSTELESVINDGMTAVAYPPLMGSAPVPRPLLKLRCFRPRVQCHAKQRGGWEVMSLWQAPAERMGSWVPPAPSIRSPHHLNGDPAAMTPSNAASLHSSAPNPTFLSPLQQAYPVASTR